MNTNQQTLDQVFESMVWEMVRQIEPEGNGSSPYVDWSFLGAERINEKSLATATT
jgi:hypothetical protein